MDQQHSQHFQTLECVVSERLTTRGRSQTKDTIQIVSPKQNIVYVQRQAQQIITTTQAPIRTETFVKPIIQQVQKVQVVDHREEVEFYKSKCLIYEKQISELNIEVTRLRSNPTVQEKITYVEDSHKVAELERQLHIYQTEIHKVTALLKETNIEVDTLKIKNSQITSQLVYYQQQSSDFDKLKKTQIEGDQFYQNEIQRLNVLVQQSQTQLQSLQATLIDSKKYEQLYIQLQSTQATLTNELERCTQVLKIKQEEFETTKLQLIKDLEIQSIRLKDFDRENKDLKQKEYSLQQQLERLNKEYQDLSDRYNTDIRSKNDEITRLTTVTQTLQLTFQDTSKFQEYEHRSKLQSEEIQLLNQKIRSKQDEVDKCKLQLHQYNLQLQEYSKYADFESKYRSIQQEYERIHNTLRLKIEENDNLRSCISKLQLTISDKYKSNDYENKIALLSQEIERLHQSLKSRQDENDKLRQELYSLQTSFPDQQIEIDRLNAQIKVRNEELEKHRSSQISNNESLRLKDLEQKNLVYSNEIDRLSNLVRVKINESEQYKQELVKLRDSSTKFTQMYNDNEKLTSLIRTLQDELDQTKRKQKLDESHLYNERMQVLVQELDSWKTQFITQNREFHKNQELLILAQAELDSLKNKRTTTLKSEQVVDSLKENKVEFKKNHTSQSTYILGMLNNKPV
ncbi:unnamed protein product (macronuclear) [Paramecium tetraurelia]|uniref:Uncharacterized protein n=1 Tax=Paramecium tetraurelia TaxID=5888 RepID=A0DIF9_PARTE|nr:uncharacterized protein GSPATT00017198001 [Paramecium tetraurelia]CAK82826.1 unnamed protein product [Paramecium tetraurelia]|eukprot:XP_001450223.1 hypothetical protein (macronuclear) [Paramecium tetraurelia strain d4-2]